MIKKMKYPEDGVKDLENALDKPDEDQAWVIPSKMKVEVLAPKSSMPNYQNKPEESDEGLIKLDMPSSSKQNRLKSS